MAKMYKVWVLYKINGIRQNKWIGFNKKCFFLKSIKAVDLSTIR